MKRIVVQIVSIKGGGGQRSMCKIVEDIVAKEMKEERIEIAKNLLNNGKLTLEEIAQCSGLTVEEVKAVKVLQPT